MKGSFLHKTGRILLWTAIAIVTLLMAIPASLYIPAVQDFAREIALRQVRKSTGMDISVELLRLSFPLKVELQSVSVADAAGDTMIAAGSLRLAVKPLPLLRLQLDVDGIEADNAFYRLGTPDSAMYLTARIDHFQADATDLGLRESTIDVGDAMLSGAIVNLRMRPDSTVRPAPDTNGETLWRIKARNITLRDVAYTMSMMPVIDSLGTRIDSAVLRNATIDMASHTIGGESLDVKLADACYIYPDSAAAAAVMPPDDAASPDTTALDTSESAIWTIRASRLRLDGASATYAMRGAIPRAGLDMNCLQASRISIEVDSFFNRGTAITVPLRHLEARERCGVTLKANGLFSMDSTAMHASHFDISTDYSQLHLDATMGMGNLADSPSLPLRLLANAAISLEDIEMALPALKPMLRGIPRGAPLRLNADISGTSGNLRISELKTGIARFFTFNADGVVKNPFDFRRMDGRVSFHADAIALNSVKPTLLEARLASQLNIPRTIIDGHVDYSPNLISGKLRAVAAGGHLALDGSWRQRAQSYDASFRADNFPVDAFMPSLGVGAVTATVNASGKGYDPTASSTAMNLTVDIDNAVYLGENYRSILVDATLADNSARGRLTSANPAADIDMVFDATLADTAYTWRIDGSLRNVDLMAMKLTTSPMGGSLRIASDGSFNPGNHRIDTRLDLTDIKWQIADMMLSTDSLASTFGSTDSTVSFTMRNGDLKAIAAAQCGLDTLLARFASASGIARRIIETRKVDAREISNSLPPLAAGITAGRNNIAQSVLAAKGMGFNKAEIDFSNDSLVALSARVLGFNSGKTRLDTMALTVNQHGRFLLYNASVNNRPGTFDAFAHVLVNGFVADDKVAAMLNQRNIKGEKGFVVGFSATVADSTVNLRLVPYKPVIGYKQWTLNRDNFIRYDFATSHLDANVEMSNDISSLHLFTNHSDSTANTRLGSEDVVLDLSNIKIQEWLSLSPFAPPIKGDVDADLRFRWDKEQITGRGTVDLRDFYYGRDRVGTFTLGLDVKNSTSGALHADASLMVDSVKVITASGSLNDSTARNPFLLDFSMIHFPLHIANPFLPKEYARLSGTLNGTMNITGSLARPIFDGYLDFDSTAVGVGMAGTSFTFSEEKIPVDSSVVHFRNFAIRGCNDNPLTVDGSVDLRDLSDIKIDLGMRARNMQVVNTKRARAGAQIYGKGFLNIDCGVKGDMRLLNVDATVDLLAGTNITYITENSDAIIASKGTGEMVTFVQFNDSTASIVTDTVASSAMAMVLDANLIVSQGSTINVEIGGDAQNRISVNGQGNLTYTMSPVNNGRLTGRYTINSGYARYSPPVMRQLDFSLAEGSYVAFTGDMMNPTLSLKATEKLKASVTSGSHGGSHLVDFFVTLSVGGTLQNMDVQFDLSTDNDLTIQNELSSMSPQQRANQAMNLLLYNTYTGPDTKATSNLSGNPLYSFLTSQLNNWMANNVRGVDISFGVDQYDSSSDGSGRTTTSYNYRVSKTLFNDRFKIVIGGNYSTDADADENFSQNLINDISFEYMLNRSGSMYVRLFRHTGYESILEGEVTQTGVGFVYKRKVRSLADVFRFLMPRRRRKTPVASPDSAIVEPQENEK